MAADPTPTGPAALPKLGRYHVRSKLGQGGMGAVYLARDDKLARDVAIKVLPPESVHDPAAVARFEREARALAKLAHPGIVQAFDSESADGRHFLVMEYVEGQSLADLLKEKGRLSPGRAADYAHQAALALQHAHDKGLVHRDLKPSNLLLSKQGQVKVLDLGLARFLQDQVADPAKTREGVGMGTPDYSAPEQFRDAHSADARSDIYALGCTLYHLLSGQVPFPGSSLSEKYRAHCEKEPAPLEELCPEAPAGLVLAVQKMMAKRPADRFQTAQEVADALTTHVAGSSPSFKRLRTTATWDRGQLTLTDLRPRRRRLILAAGAVLLAALLVGVGFGLSRYLRPTPSNTPDPVAARPDEKTDPKKEDPRGEVPDDPNVLTVAKTGKAKYRTINAALEKVSPGQTIRVLDEETYEEAITLRSASRFANITLEAPRHATIDLTPKAKASAFYDGERAVAIFISNIPGVKVRGFRLRNNGLCTLVGVEGACSGVTLDQLQLDLLGGERSVGIDIIHSVIAEHDSPVRVQDCRITGGWRAIEITGHSLPCSGVVCRNNVLLNPTVGIHLDGNLHRILVVGNRIVESTANALDLALLHEEARDILYANNTTLGCWSGLTVIDRPKGRNVVVRNNLFLGSTNLDMIHLNWNGSFVTSGDGKSVHAVYQIAQNWREVREPAGYTAEGRAWIPPQKDVRQDRIDGIDRDAKSPDFLRPAADSPLATSGAGATDPALPRYVGALPPKGVEPWDWDRTWRALAPKTMEK